VALLIKLKAMNIDNVSFKNRNQAGIYIITFSKNLQYVGATSKSFMNRWNDHDKALRNNNHYNNKIRDAYSANPNPTFSVLNTIYMGDTHSKDALRDAENLAFKAIKPKLNILLSSGIKGLKPKPLASDERLSVYEMLKDKVSKYGFEFEKQQQPYMQNNRDLELKFIHPELTAKLKTQGYKCKGTKFYIKPLEDKDNGQIGFVNGKTTSLPILFPSNTVDAFDNSPAWTDESINRLLTNINNFLIK
jgi:hypothetical protein